jgi:hypothetical protein
VSTVSADQLADARRHALGWGLRCDAIYPGVDISRDLVLAVDPVTQAVDLAGTEGADNLTQCLTVALTTALGDDVFNTAFGFDGLNALAEETRSMMVRERVRVSIIRVLQRDPRVRNIVDLKILDRRLDPTPRPDDPNDPDAWRTLTVNVVFETVAGETNTMSFVTGGANA